MHHTSNTPASDGSYPKIGSMRDAPLGKSPVAALVAGLDSCVMVGLLACDHVQVTPIFVRSGLRWEDDEFKALTRFFETLDSVMVRSIVEISMDAAPFYESHWSTGSFDVPDAQQPDEAWYLPGRNLLLLSAAALYGGTHNIGRLAIGLLGSNPFTDATPEFLRSFELMAGIAMDTNFEVLTPLAGMHKADVIRAGQSFPIGDVLSCASPIEGRHCGICGKCGERRHGFVDAGIYDPTRYMNHLNL